MPSDNNQEMFPIVDEQGNITGAATRGECHSGSKLLHPVIHLHVFNSKGDLYLQKRPEWKDGALKREMTVKGFPITLTATRGECRGTSHWIDFSWDNPEVTFADILEVFGELPIPPYLNRDTEESDKETYQTVYSKIKGSVAAPTAGLHFTPRVLEALQEKGIDLEELTLHVGAGTFKPVKSEEIEGHEMHTEYISVNRATIKKLIDHDGCAVAVGTTSVRTLESLYHIGVTLAENPDATEEELHVKQWQPYEKYDQIPVSYTHLTLPTILLV